MTDDERGRVDEIGEARVGLFEVRAFLRAREPYFPVMAHVTRALDLLDRMQNEAIAATGKGGRYRCPQCQKIVAAGNPAPVGCMECAAGRPEGEARVAGDHDLIALIHRACTVLRTIVTDDEANVAALAALAAAKVTTLEDRAIDADNDRDEAKREATAATERAAELSAAIERGGLDLSLCRNCSCLVACIPDGLPYCDRCALGEEKRQQGEAP